MKNEDVLTRFNEKYQVDSKTGCWIWTGTTGGPDTGGLFSWTFGNRISARVAAWRLFKKTPLMGKIITTCGQLLCVCPDHFRTTEENERLFDKIDKQENGCWIWIGATDPTGAGKFILDGGKMISVHIYLLEQSGVEIPQGVFTKHSCGNSSCVNPEHTVLADAEYRFWQFVDRDLPEDECWNWKGELRRGYGRFNGAGAHRFAYEKFIGPIPDGMFVCHTCDNRKCVNFHHFFLGTNEDNQADKVKKGRQAKGDKNGFAKLSEDQAREIKTLLKEGWKAIDIIRQKGYTRNEVYMISTGNTWAWLEV